jgi:hypothetical protein
MKYQAVDDRSGKVVAEFATREEAKMYILKNVKYYSMDVKSRTYFNLRTTRG